MKNTAPGEPRQATCSSKMRAEIPQPKRVPTRAPWIVRADSAAISAKTGPRKRDGRPISPSERVMLAVLESYCRSRRFCWPSNGRLAEDTGRSARSVQLVLRQLELDGIILRVTDGSGQRTVRTGIILVQRLTPGTEALGPGELAEIIEAMRAERTSRRGGAGAKDSSPVDTKRFAPERGARNCALNEDRFVLKKEESPKNDGGIAETGERKRPETRSPSPEPETVNAPALIASLAGMLGQDVGKPAVADRTSDPRGLQVPASETPKDQAPAPVEVLATNPVPVPLSLGQKAFLESLGPDARVRLDALPQVEQTKILAPHRLGLDRVIAAEQMKRLKPAPIAAALPIPATTSELWQQLPGAPAHWVSMAANALVQDFGSEANQRYWAAFTRLAQDVWQGSRSPEVVLDSHRQAMGPKARNRGATFNHALRAHGIVWGGNGGPSVTRPVPGLRPG